MRYSAQLYARALAELLIEHPRREKELLNQFVKVVQKTGDMRHIGHILDETEKLLVREEGGHTVVVESARPLETKTVALLTKSFGAKDQIKIAVKKDLIAGVRIVIDDEWTIDASMKKKLQKLFQAA